MVIDIDVCRTSAQCMRPDWCTKISRPGNEQQPRQRALDVYHDERGVQWGPTDPGSSGGPVFTSPTRGWDCTKQATMTPRLHGSGKYSANQQGISLPRSGPSEGSDDGVGRCWNIESLSSNIARF